MSYLITFSYTHYQPETYSVVTGWDETSHFSELEAVHVGGKLGGEECGVVVVGNRMDIQVGTVDREGPVI